MEPILPALALGSTLATIATILAVTFGAIFGAVALFWIVGAIFKGIGWALASIGRLIGHVFACLKGIIVETARAVGALVSAIVLLPMALMSVAFGRWAAANHYVRASGQEARELGTSLYLATLGWPFRLVGLGSLVDGFEDRMSDVVATAPRAEGDELEFPGYTIVSTLPRGGSGAQLFVARATDEHREQMSAQGVELPERVVVKAFGFGFGSNLPQMMRENRALDAARRMGLVFEHSADGERFWYVMPYVPGEDLGVVTRRLHDDAGAEGLDAAGLDAVVGYACELVRIIGRFHDAGVWHKDIKPSNIVANGPHLELVDLGLVTPLASAMTLTTHGTEYYRDPDLVRQAMRGVKVHEVDGVKFDLYSAGAVVYSMVEDSFPAHGNLSRFTKRCPEALAWIVRRAMADASQRYASANAMLDDLAVVAAAKDPFALRPADLPSMGGTSIERPTEPDRPLPPLRPVTPVASPTPTTPPLPPRRGTVTPPPLPHQRRRLERDRRRAERQARCRRRDDERARARRERPKSSPFAIGAMATLFLMFLFAGVMALALSPSSMHDGGVYVARDMEAASAPSQMHASAEARRTRVQDWSGDPATRTSATLAGAGIAEAAGSPDVAPDGAVATTDGPLVVLLTERPFELLESVEREQLDAVVAELTKRYGWRFVTESANGDGASTEPDAESETLLAEARSAALMHPVGNATGEERLQAWLDAGATADAVLWIGFDDDNRLTRHAVVVATDDDMESLGVERSGRAGFPASLAGSLR